ncbi:MAG: response regulator [Deltaproteobacteria bacterium]|nr:MAG: response regulator [Deltaproteobacteria bacterium]
MKKKKVLIVDNSRLYVEFLSETLIKANYDICQAYNGMEALEKVVAERPDYIILDIIMPKIEGGRVCRYLKSNPDFRDIPIIILTGVAAESAAKVKGLGADAYIAKGAMDEIEVNLLNTLKILERPRKAPEAKKELIYGIEGVIPRDLVGELLLNKKHYETIFENMGEGVIEIDSDRKIIFVNPAALDIINQSEIEVIGKMITDIFDDRKGSDLKNILKKVSGARGLVNERITYQYGEKILQLNFSNIIEEGEFKGVFIIIQDITEKERLARDLKKYAQELEHKIIEIDRTQMELIKSEKLAATSKLVAGVAHEIKNPLNSISLTAANLEHITNSSKPLPEIKRFYQEHIELLKSDIERVKDLVENFMRFTRPSAIHLKLKDINEIVDSALKSIAPQAKQNKVRLISRYDKGLPKIMVEEDELYRCFINLFLNSLEAMEKGGKLTLETRGSTKEIAITVSDTGGGIPREIQDKIFDIFFSTKDGGKGLGLSQVYRTVEALGGEISVHSKVGKGTKFTIAIPKRRNREKAQHISS